MEWNELSENISRSIFSFILFLFADCDFEILCVVKRQAKKKKLWVGVYTSSIYLMFMLNVFPSQINLFFSQHLCDHLCSHI
jgi:hypothetical protein